MVNPFVSKALLIARLSAFASSMAWLTVGATLPSLAFTPERTIYESQAEGKEGQIITLPISPSLGMTLNFLPTVAVIQRAWLDDPSRVTLSFDSPLPGSSSNGSSSGGASVLHLRQINPLHFTALPSNPSGITTLTLVASSPQGRKLYEFEVIPTKSSPTYTTLTILPDRDRPQPLFSPAMTPSPPTSVIP